MVLISLENFPKLEEAKILSFIKFNFFQIFRLNLVAINKMDMILKYKLGNVLNYTKLNLKISNKEN